MSKGSGIQINQKCKGVFLGIPCYAGDIRSETARTVSYAQQIDELNVLTSYGFGSLLAASFNRLFCQALNARADGIQYFVLLHSDIWATQQNWLPLMLSILEEHELDVLSVLSPIKSLRGMTSTAFDSHPWRPRRLTMSEALQLPPTFTNHQVAMQGWPGLLFNTGLMMIRMTKPWVEEVCFTINDQISKNAAGVFESDVEPEDWHFSRWCNARGLKTAVTRRIIIQHFGPMMFDNQTDWGDDKYDMINGPFAGPLQWTEPAELNR